MAARLYDTRIVRISICARKTRAPVAIPALPSSPIRHRRMRLHRIDRGDGRFCRQEVAAAGRPFNRMLNERQFHAPAAHSEGPMPFSTVTGDLPKIIANQERLYEGDLTFYFRILFFKSSN